MHYSEKSNLYNTDRYHDSPLPKTSSLVENCTKFGQFVLSKIIKIAATSCQILRLKCTKFDFGWGSAPGPATHSAPQTPRLDLRGLLLRGGEGRTGKGRGTGGKDGEGEERRGDPLLSNTFRGHGSLILLQQFWYHRQILITCLQYVHLCSLPVLNH